MKAVTHDHADRLDYRLERHLCSDDILDEAVVNVVSKKLQQPFVMTNKVSFRELSFCHVLGDAQYLNWRAILVAFGDDFASAHPPPPSVMMPDPALAVGNFEFCKVRVIIIAVPTEVIRVRVTIEETKALAKDVRGVIPE